MPGRHSKPRFKRELKELTTLYEISRILDKSLDLKQVAKPVLSALAEHMGMAHGTLTLLNRETGEINIEAAHGLSKSALERGRYKPGEGVTGKVIQKGRAVVVPRVSKEPLFLNKTGARKQLRKKDISFICVPIKLANEVIGALSADHLFSERISFEEDVRLLSIIASMISQAVSLRRSVQEEKQRLLEENRALRNQLRVQFRPDNIIGNSRVMQETFDLIGTVSKSDASVLLCGESGTGKELFASAIHYNSLRANKPFIKVNCAALPESVIESELFGHEKGAFTGAIAERKGRFELANGGTLFLDEIGELSPKVQIKLLRVLQEKEFERVGGTKTIKIKVRIITASNQDIEKMVAEGRFREDLYYRLNVFQIFIPHLRDRKTDIPLLADHFIEKYNKENHKKVRRISTPAIDMLMAYHWPGNVRELENCIERAVILSLDDVLHGHHLPPSLQTAEASGTSLEGTLQAKIDNVERELILDALKSARGNTAKAARKLGISERIMGLRIKKHQIYAGRFKKRSGQFQKLSY